MREVTEETSQREAAHPAGFLTITLHAHLPYVIHHGTWPHGMEWLHEAAAETYLPLLRVLANLERDGIALRCNLNLSPVLLEQLAHPVFRTEFPKYLARKIVAAREDEAFFIQSGETHYAETARFWYRFFTQANDDFDALGQDIVKGFRHFHDLGLIEILTCAASHGYLPLLGTDESVRAQIRTAVQVHRRHIGSHPRGIWSPECGYRPAGFWNYPVLDDGASEPRPGFDRIGVEQALSESGIEFFYVDTHLVEEARRAPSPPNLPPGTLQVEEIPEPDPAGSGRRLYQPHFVEGGYGGELNQRFAVTVFARDPRTGMQVWSGEKGYPADGNYLDFHKKRWPGGHRYWRVTDAQMDMTQKQPYFGEHAAERTRVHAAHFVQLVEEALAPFADQGAPPVLCAPFDAELFGHWWFEGAHWLEAVAREIHRRKGKLSLISSVDYLAKYPRADCITMSEGSWGAEGNNQVWMNPETKWTYACIYPAEIYLREVCTEGRWRASAEGGRIVKQMCRELLLLESSDWQFLITTGAARDYAEVRFHTHMDQFNALKAAWREFEATGGLPPEAWARVEEIEARDDIFAEVDPEFWVVGAHNNAGETTV